MFYNKNTTLVPCQAFFVGRVERSETRHVSSNQYVSGFASLYPTYKIELDKALVIDKVIHVVLSSVFILFGIILLGCERIQPIIPPQESATKIKIGLIYSPPDPGTTRNGAEIAVALANEAGGIDGVPIELLIRDDKRDGSLSVRHANDLIAEGVLAIVGPDYSAIAMAIGPIVEQHRIPMITTYPTNPKVTEGSYYTFMGAYTDPYQGRVMANFAIKTLEAMSAAQC